MNIVADANIAFVKQAFSAFGEVATCRSSEINAAQVRDCDLLLVRSTIKVNQALLENSRVRFVATATIGTNHFDLDYFRQHNITWASAPGSNAASVAEWFAAALFHGCAVAKLDPTELQIGIVGVGAVGGRIERFCRTLGRPPLLCDPPRQRREGGDFVGLDELLPKCDVVTFHVPLYRDSQDATFHLLDEKTIAILRPGALIINASRGEVIDSSALLPALRSGSLQGVFDVFEREPAPDANFIAASLLATPHIAGHSLDGKVRGTQMIYDAACGFVGIPPTWKAVEHLPPRSVETIILDDTLDDLSAFRGAIETFYSIVEDDRALRAIMLLPESQRGRAFREYRENYPARRELGGLPIKAGVKQPLARSLLRSLSAPR